MHIDIGYFRKIRADVHCFIIGNGPGLVDYDLSLIGGHLTIGTNRSFLVHEPDILMWSDRTIVEQYRNELLQLEKSGVLLLPKNSASNQVGYTCNQAYVAELKSTGACAAHFAFEMGCRKVVMLGCGCCYRGSMTNFYGVNKDHDGGTLDRCREGLRWVRERWGEERVVVDPSVEEFNAFCGEDSSGVFDVMRKLGVVLSRHR